MFLFIEEKTKVYTTMTNKCSLTYKGLLFTGYLNSDNYQLADFYYSEKYDTKNAAIDYIKYLKYFV